MLLPKILLLGNLSELETVIARTSRIKWVSTLEMGNFSRTPQEIAVCEEVRVRTSIIPSYRTKIQSYSQLKTEFQLL